MSNHTHNIFQEAHQYILPSTPIFDFFDYLAGEKLQLSDDRSISEEMMVTFKFNQQLPKPSLYKYRKPDSKEGFKSIKLK